MPPALAFSSDTLHTAALPSPSALGTFHKGEVGAIDVFEIQDIAVLVAAEAAVVSTAAVNRFSQREVPLH
jgi:hypothetical protein